MTQRALAHHPAICNEPFALERKQALGMNLTAAETIRYAVEELRTPKAFGAHFEVGDERLDSSDIYACTSCASLSDEASARFRNETEHRCEHRLNFPD
jgi:hypothetical protein